MTYDELMQEMKDMDRKSIEAYFDAPLPEGYKNVFNPWHDKRFMLLKAANFYSDFYHTMQFLKGLEQNENLV